jgi:hypothetical protein
MGLGFPLTVEDSPSRPLDPEFGLLGRSVLRQYQRGQEGRASQCDRPPGTANAGDSQQKDVIRINGRRENVSWEILMGKFPRW